MTTHAGSCHCGAVKFTFTGEIDNAITCNCSYCRRAGHVLVFGALSDLNVQADADKLGTYFFNKNVIAHYFCNACGITTHGTGEGPGGPMAAINVRCIPSVDTESLKVTHFDGASL